MRRYHRDRQRAILAILQFSNKDFGSLRLEELRHGVKVSIANSKLSSSPQYCVWQGMYANVTLTGTTFSGCTAGDVFKEQ